MEKVLEEVSFRATELAGQTITIDAAYVNSHMQGVPFTDEVSKYIL
jgi:ATP-dependent HslUV protease ATP-binding subunit HslU